MPRRRVPTDAGAAEPHRRRRRPFDELARLRAQLRSGTSAPPSEHPAAEADAQKTRSSPSDATQAGPGARACKVVATPDARALPPGANPGERALFEAAMSDVVPLKDAGRAELAIPPPPPEPLKRSEDERAALREAMDAPLSFEDRLEMGDEAAFLRAGLPRRVLLDLRRSRWVLQGELDLHGLTRDEARAALGRFLASSLQRGCRCVRVIHGKGLRSPGRQSILKQLSRGWLAQREEILAFCQAGPHEGGSGALLVLLRARNPDSAGS